MRFLCTCSIPQEEILCEILLNFNLANSILNDYGERSLS